MDDVKLLNQLATTLTRLFMSAQALVHAASCTFGLLAFSRLSSESDDVCCLFFLWRLCFFLCLDFFSLGGFCLLASILPSYDSKFEYATCTANTYVSRTATGVNCQTSSLSYLTLIAFQWCARLWALTSAPAPACAAASRRAPHPSRFALLSALDCN